VGARALAGQGGRKRAKTLRRRASIEVRR